VVDVLGKAAVLVAIVAVGFGSKKVGWTSASDFGVLTRILLRITLPCALATSFNSYTITPSLLYISGLAIVIVVTQLLAGYWLGRHGGRPARAFGVLNVGSSNIGLFAMPYLGAFIGPQAIVFAALFDIGNSFAAAGIAYAWALTIAKDKPVTLPNLAKTVFSSVVFDVYLALLLLGLFRIKLPAPVLALTSTVGSANTFLAMFSIGVGLEIALSRSKYLVAAKHLATRYVLAAAWILVVWFLLPLEHEVKIVVCLLLVAPLAAMMSAFTAEADLDVEASTFITSVTVLVAIVGMPLLMGVLG
jgi:predicted permease